MIRWNLDLYKALAESLRETFDDYDPKIPVNQNQDSKIGVVTSGIFTG
jgi:hypothetical protein